MSVVLLNVSRKQFDWIEVLTRIDIALVFGLNVFLWLM